MQVSVIIPVFNAAAYLSEAVASALEQPETAEVILVEDGSTDNSWQVIQQLTKQYNLVKTLRFVDGKNHGPAAARNLGIDHAKYEFIAFLDADDFYLPQRFVKTKKLFQEFPQTQVAYAPVGFFHENETAQQLHRQHSADLKVIDFRATHSADFFEQYLLGKHGYVSFDGVVVKKEVFATVGRFDAQLRHAEDADLILHFAIANLLQRTDDIRPVTLARIHPQRSVYNLPKMYAGRTQFFQKWLYLATKNNWNKTINRFLLRRTLEIEFLAKYVNTNYEKNVFIRLTYKGIRLITYLFKYPILIKKIFCTTTHC